mmetsp:Transcript_32026/g.76394  ORF Transcript_32026/g.76394 Transcript_32026/m.76394 type:complete len:133 (-) Transcript_32026:104-502(-)
MEDFLPLLCWMAFCGLLLLMWQVTSRKRWCAQQGEPTHAGLQLGSLDWLAKAIGFVPEIEAAGAQGILSLQLESVTCPCETCVICLDSLSTASKLSCGHLYHAACIEEWCLQRRRGDIECPLCRAQHTYYSV